MIVPVLLVVIPCLLTVLADPTKYANLLCYAIFGVLILAAFIHSFAFQYSPYLKVDKKWKMLLVQAFFRQITDSIKSRSPNPGTLSTNPFPYRLNIMKPRFNIIPWKSAMFRKCLVIEHQWNMDNHPDLGIVLNPGRGVAGKAFQENRPKIGDTTLMSQTGSADWNLTKEEKAVTASIKSIISVPIRDDIDKNKVIAMLNVDSTLHLRDTPFQNPDFQMKLEDTSKLLVPFVQ